MGTVIVDGNKDLITYDGQPTSLSEVLDEVERLCEEKEREISQIKINGNHIPPENINEWMNKTVDEIDTMEIETVSAQELSLRQLLTASSYVADIENIIEQYIEDGKMEYQDAVLTVVSIMNKWEEICKLIDFAANQLNVDYVSIEFNDMNFQQQHLASMEIINELTKAMSDKDVVSIRDILEYRFVPQIKTYSELIKAIAKEFENGLAR